MNGPHMTLRSEISNLGFRFFLVPLCLGVFFVSSTTAEADDFQPLSANVFRVVNALAQYGAPLDDAVIDRVVKALNQRDADGAMEELDRHVSLLLTLDSFHKLKA